MSKEALRSQKGVAWCAAVLCVLPSGCGGRDTEPNALQLLAGNSEGVLLAGLNRGEEVNSDAGEIVIYNGFKFYSDPLERSGPELSMLAEHLRQDWNYSEWEENEYCGGFHPDWIFLTSEDEEIRAYLFCFGCTELRVVAGDRTEKFTMTLDGQRNFLSILQK